ncbi:hypothetical protein M406DRAFT_326609 [Cryphonectria parasitica EP155]|uniref:Uncharacterized protein n=1 Tax=Cryphonectria parasitica (strain ATCC 38755 / EP155) TaxID=660469 RepID=A0A9P4YDY0_CRYP1|nr:uncharacterized protein M406DRAFT_326609 [Cryphonectria parasitica EP155]KAF3771218.1 hypothetical protein M406DRAFT_326609 [Cryphonectria parasitica EP155]
MEAAKTMMSGPAETERKILKKTEHTYRGGRRGYYALVQDLPLDMDLYEHDIHGEEWKWFDDPLPTNEDEDRQSGRTEFTRYHIANPQVVARGVIPTLNLSLPAQCFDNDEDAETFLHAIGKRHNTAVVLLGKAKCARTLCVFLDSVFHKDVRSKLTEGTEVPEKRQIPLAARRFRFWNAVAKTGLGQDLGMYVARHLVLMLASALRNYTREPKGNSGVYESTRRIVQWLDETDPGMIEEFEDEEDPSHRPTDQDFMPRSSKKRKADADESPDDLSDHDRHNRKRTRYHGPLQKGEEGDLPERPKKRKRA